MVLCFYIITHVLFSLAIVFSVKMCFLRLHPPPIIPYTVLRFLFVLYLRLLYTFCMVY